MLSWESTKIGYNKLLKSTIKLAKKAISNAKIKTEDIGLIVHGGVYREHFRTEPAFATHIHGGLNIHCTNISFDSPTCFSFDVTDGSCSPHIALQSISDLLPSLKNKFALLERALSNFMLDNHVNKNGYTEISPPLMATENTMYGTGQLPKFENDQFEIKFDDKNDRKF